MTTAIHQRSVTAAGCLLALLVSWVLIPSSRGQLPTGQGSFNPALLQVFGNNKAFVGRTDLRMSDKNNKEIIRMPMLMSFLEGKVRVEVSLNDISSTSLASEATQLFKQAGMDRVVSILRPDRKVSVIAFPTSKIFAEEPMSAADAAGYSAHYELKSSELGRESVEGHPCVKNKITVQNSAGVTVQGVVWNATDLKNFPIKIQLPEGDSLVEMTFKEVKLQKPEISTFEAPVGYRRYDSMEKLVQERLSSMLGGSKK